MNASSPGLARLFGTGCAGIAAGVRRCPSQQGQRYLPRTWRSTRTCIGNDVELLAHHLAEALELHAVMRAGAFVFGQSMLDVDAR